MIISKAVIFPIWIFSFAVLFVIVKWAGPSIDAERRSRKEAEPKIGQSLPAQIPITSRVPSLVMILSFGILPFIVPLSLLHLPVTTLITDSIPDHRVLVTAIMSIVFILIAYLNRQMFNKNFYGGGPAALFLVGSLSNIAYSDWYYRMAYEQYLFSGKIDFYSRVAFINRLSLHHGRGGPFFFGHVNPNNVSTIDPEIELTIGLYNLLVRTDNDGAVVPNGYPTCSVRLAVERSGNAERIVTRSLFDTPDVVECQRPV